MTNERKLQYILNAVAEEWGVSAEKIKSKSRKRVYVEPRHIYCKLAISLTKAILRDIGGLLNGRDHTTVLHGIKHAEDLIYTEYDVKERYNKVFNKIKPKLLELGGHLPPFPGVALLYRPYPKLMIQA